MDKNKIDKRFARTQKAAAQRYREEEFCKLPEPDGYYEIPMPDGTLQYFPHYDREELEADNEMAYVDEITERIED